MCVVQIINYTSSLWGFKKFEVIDNIQNRFLMIPVLKNPKLSGFLGGFFRQRGMAYLVFDNAKWGFKKFQAKSRDRDAGIKVRCLNIIRFWNVTFIPNLVFFFTKLVFNIDNNQCLLNNCFWCSKIKDIYYDI